MKLSRILTGLAMGSAILAPGAAGANSGSEVGGFEVGARFPELELPSLTDGKPMSLGSFRGRKLVLHVWASW